MTSDLIAILHLFRIGNRFVERTCGEIADRMELLPIQANHLVGELVKKGFVKGRPTNDPHVRAYFLSDKGKAWMNVQPPKKARRLTAVPK